MRTASKRREESFCSVGHLSGTGFVLTGSLKRGPLTYELEIFEDRQARLGLGWIDCASDLLAEVGELPRFELILADGNVVEAIIIRSNNGLAYIRTVGDPIPQSH
jgi:hypothetical protein